MNALELLDTGLSDHMYQLSELLRQREACTSLEEHEMKDTVLHDEISIVSDPRTVICKVSHQA